MARHRSQTITSKQGLSAKRTTGELRPSPALCLFVGTVAAAALVIPPPALAQGTSAPGTGRTATRDLGPPKYDRPPSAGTDKICNGKTIIVRGVIKSVVNWARCDQAILGDINAAHKSEGIPRMTRPAGFEKLSPVEQLVWLVNAERTVRGEPALTEDKSYDAMAQQAAVANDDPSGPNGYIYGGVAGGGLTSLDVMYGWMYDDGPGGSNGACRPGDYSGCWAHRGHLLLNCPGKVGAGVHQGYYTVVVVCEKGYIPKGMY